MNFKVKYIFLFNLLLACPGSYAQVEGREVISLNGQWKFYQTKTSFPPVRDTRKISVPGQLPDANSVNFGMRNFKASGKMFSLNGSTSKISINNYNYYPGRNATPEAFFIDLTDERYTKHIAPHRSGCDMAINMLGIYDL